MKKLIALLLALVMVLTFAACANTNEGTNTTEKKDEQPAEPKLVTYEEYKAAELETPVIVECYVQAHQNWWDNKVTVYAQDKDGGYFMYEMACSEEDAEKLTPGTKIRVTGTKTAWEGEVEIVDATFTFVEGAEPYVAKPVDVTALIGSTALEDFQNCFVSFKGVTVKEVKYQNAVPGDDIYITVTSGDKELSLCIEKYLTGPSTEVYETAGELKAGDVIDVEGYLYWYQGANPHIVSIEIAK